MHALIRYIPGVVLYIANIIFTFSQLEASKRLRKGKGPLLTDRWYDDKNVLDEIVEKGYLPLVKPRGYGARGYGARLRDKLWRDFKMRELHKMRGVGEGFFGAFENWFGSRLNVSRNDTLICRSLARVLAYELRIYLRFVLAESNNKTIFFTFFYDVLEHKDINFYCLKLNF